MPDFADASKLIADITDLRWSDTSLYALLFHYLSNASSEQGGHTLGVQRD